MAIVLLKHLAAGAAPATVRRPEPLVHHVNVKPVNAIGQLFRHNGLHGFQIAGVVTKPSNRRAIYITHFVFRMRLQEMAALLYHTIGNHGHVVFGGFVHNFAQRIALSQSRCFGQQCGIVIGVIAVAHPHHQIFTVCLDTVPDNIRTVETGAIPLVFRVTMAKLCAGWSHFHTC